MYRTDEDLIVTFCSVHFPKKPVLIVQELDRDDTNTLFDKLGLGEDRNNANEPLASWSFREIDLNARPNVVSILNELKGQDQRREVEFNLVIGDVFVFDGQNMIFEWRA